MDVAHWIQTRARCASRMPGKLAVSALKGADTLLVLSGRIENRVYDAKLFIRDRVEDVKVNIDHFALIAKGIMDDSTDAALFDSTVVEEVGNAETA